MECIIENIVEENKHRILLNIGGGKFEEGGLSGSVIIGVDATTLVNFNDGTSMSVSAKDVAQAIINYKQAQIKEKIKAE